MGNSMTGYGRAVDSINGQNISVEIRSVNHRFLDITTKIPRSLLSKEDKIKKIIQGYFHRGRIEVFITIDGEGILERKLTVNWDLVDQYIHKLKEIQNRYQLGGTIEIGHLVNQADLLTVDEKEQHADWMEETIVAIVTNAAKQVLEMRKKEGNELITDLTSRLRLVNNIVKVLGDRRDIVIIEYRDRIKKRLESYIGDFISDESKIVQEVALLAEKGDISEEITRLESHLLQFDHLLTNQSIVGRKLDFIVQEMHREANTVGSKSNDVKISELVVQLKSEIEKIKEQVQNIE